MIQRNQRTMEVIGMSFKVISMFSGAGGLDMGFHNKGFEILGQMILRRMHVIHMINGPIIIKMEVGNRKKSVQ